MSPWGANDVPGPRLPESGEALYPFAMSPRIQRSGWFILVLLLATLNLVATFGAV